MSIEDWNKKESWAFSDEAKKVIDELVDRWNMDRDLAIEVAIQTMGEERVYDLYEFESPTKD